MSVVIVGGHDRMVTQYKKICKEYHCKAKVFTHMCANMSNQIGRPVCGSWNYLFCKQSVTAFLMDHTIFSGSSERTGHGYRYASVLSGRIFLWKAFCDNVCDRIVDSIFVLSA